jgi:hypothetical protein
VHRFCQSATGLFAQIAGDWPGTGEVCGMTSVQLMSWQAVLDGSFLRLSFDNRMTAVDGNEKCRENRGQAVAQRLPGL